MRGGAAMRQTRSRTGRGLRGGWFARWRADQDGSATVEFALLLPVYLAIFGSAFELGVHMTKQVMLDRATDLVVRDLRLGNFDDPDQDAIRTAICARTGLIPDCQTNLLIEMTPISTSTWQVLPSQATCVDKAQDIEPVVTFNDGLPNDMMLIRVCAMVEPMFPTTGLGLQMPKVAGHYSVVSTSAFVNEPGA